MLQKEIVMMKVVWRTAQWLEQIQMKNKAKFNLQVNDRERVSPETFATIDKSTKQKQKSKIQFESILNFHIIQKL